MKKYINIIIALSLLVFSSCSDLLDQAPQDEQTSKDYWVDTKSAESGLAAAYSQIESSNAAYVFGEVRYTVEPFREDMIAAGPDAYGYPDWLQLAEFTYNNANTQTVVYWEDAYRGIMHSNQVLAKVPAIEKIDAKYKDEILAEATFLRGYYHLKLLLNWERIIVQREYEAQEKKIDKELSPRIEAWEFIIQNFIDAEKNLPLKQNADRLGRATKGAALSYLGYAYLTRAYEEPSKKAEFLKKAEDAFIQVKGYELVEDLLSMFNGTNKNSSESIFEIQFSDNTDGGAYYRHYLHKFVGCSQLGGWGGIRPSKSLLTEFKKEGKIATTGRYDTRAYKTLYFDDDYYRDPSTEMVYGYNFDEVFIQPEKGDKVEFIEFRKYLPPTEELLYRSNSAINVPLMRFADVKLMLAEAYNEQGKPELAIPLINDVRKRADMPDMEGTSQTAVRAQIEHERIVEFALENTRFYDLRRWGKTKQALHAIGRTNFDPEKHDFYPIPQREISTNKVLREQLEREKEEAENK